MVELQVLNKVLKDQDASLLTLNGITDEYFVTYPNEYRFMMKHLNDYGNIPDKETFLATFPNFSLLDVLESDKYLLDTLSEEHLYAITVPVINKIAEIIQTDSGEAVNYLQSKLPELQLNTAIRGVDIISSSGQRFKEWQERKENPSKFCIPTGFPELDEITGGWQRGEELIVLVMRTGQGKSWILIKSLGHAWKLGFRVGLIEPEMSYSKTGYRFDTLTGNISNTSLLRGNEAESYGKHIKTLQHSKTPFVVATPKDFNRKITVSKLKAFIKANKLDILGIDGIGYLTDERKQRGDNRTTQLTNISEDLMDLSIELGIPVIVVAQSNRSVENKEDGPEVDNIRDSDGIAYNASIVISGVQKGPGIELNPKKNRNGKNNEKLLYAWDIDIGVFNFVPNSENTSQADTEGVERVRSEYSDGREAF